jgi:hypothetical protein
MGIDLKQLNGIMDTDSPNDAIGRPFHKMGRNIRFRGVDGNVQPEGVLGNTLISNNLPSGANQCIGSFFDTVKQRLIWFNWNSNGKNGIYQYKLSTQTISSLLVCFTNSATDILQFDLDYKIPSVNIIYTTDADGDIMTWTDRLNRPIKLNLKDAENNIYGANWIVDYLTIARRVPMTSPSCSYQDDATITINNLRKKLYEFRYRYVYKDFTKSTWSAYGKLFAPRNPDDIATDINNQKNNRIDVSLNSGGADCVKIEVGARIVEGTTFSFDFLVATLDKATLSIADNSLYTFNFYNDSSYPFLDPKDTGLLFDYVPKKCNCQELLNGNVIVYGAPTFGYDFGETLNITTSITSVDYIFTGSNVTITANINNSFNSTFGVYNVSGAFVFSGIPVTGDVYNITLQSGIWSPTIDPSFTTTVSYTVLLGDTLADVVLAFRSLMESLTQYPTISGEVAFGNNSTTVTIDNILPDGASDVVNVTNISYVYANSNAPVDGVSNSIYKQKSRYGFGLVYFDQYGVTDGVHYDATLLLETPELSTTGNNSSTIPRISFSINHQPPIWAYSYSWVRTNNLTVQTLLATVTCSTAKDSGGTPLYAYLEITNQQNNQNNFPVYDFSEGDRVRIVGKYGAAVGSVYDFPISSLKTAPTINGVVETGKIFILIPYDAVLSAFGTVGNNNYDIEIYTPAINVSLNEQFFYEFGETYLVINQGQSNRAHQGQLQDQIVGAQPATFAFIRGDFYIRQRSIPFNADLSSVTTIWIIDQSVSDKYPSKTTGNGRVFTVDPYAKETYFPSGIRWSLSYQQDTNINQTNKFYFLNFDEIDRAKGDIQRMKTRDRILRVFQNRGCAQMGVYSKFIQDSGGNNILTTTDEIITTNNVQYYEGEFGLGGQYCGLASGKIQDYFIDPVRNYQCRLSNDGIIPISEIYFGRFYIQPLFSPYNFNTYLRPDGSQARIIMFYDFHEENCCTVLQGGSYNGKSIQNYYYTFNEKRNGFEQFSDLQPEWITQGADITYSWKNGALYIHNNEAKLANFFGVQYKPSITLVFNDKVAVRKTFNTVSYQSNSKWVSPVNGNILTSEINEQTGLPQISQLQEVDYSPRGNYFDGALLRDANSMSDARLALQEGDYLEGQWLEITFICNSLTRSSLFSPYLNWELNNRNF